MDDIVKYTSGWLKKISQQQGIVVWLASPYPGNTNNVCYVNYNGNVNNNNNNTNGVRPVASKKLWYSRPFCYYREVLETNYYPLFIFDRININ